MSNYLRSRKFLGWASAFALLAVVLCLSARTQQVNSTTNLSSPNFTAFASRESHIARPLAIKRDANAHDPSRRTFKGRTAGTEYERRRTSAAAQGSHQSNHLDPEWAAVHHRRYRIAPRSFLRHNRAVLDESAKPPRNPCRATQGGAVHPHATHAETGSDVGHGIVAEFSASQSSVSTTQYAPVGYVSVRP